MQDSVCTGPPLWADPLSAPHSSSGLREDPRFCRDPKPAREIRGGSRLAAGGVVMLSPIVRRSHLDLGPGAPWNTRLTHTLHSK